MKGLRILPVLLASLFLTSCVGFQSKWNKSVSDYRAGKISAPEGPWEGTWATKTNGHTGNLKAIVSKAPDGEYDFHYYATWKKFLQGGYKVRFPVTRSGSTYYVDGEKDLGIFGSFGHKAKITRNSYEATYSNDKGDLGTFSMKRPD